MKKTLRNIILGTSLLATGFVAGTQYNNRTETLSSETLRKPETQKTGQPYTPTIDSTLDNATIRWIHGEEDLIYHPYMPPFEAFRTR